MKKNQILFLIINKLDIQFLVINNITCLERNQEQMQFEVTQQHQPSTLKEKITSEYIQDCFYEDISMDNKKKTFTEYLQQFSIVYNIKMDGTIVMKFQLAQGDIEVELFQQASMHYHTEDYGVSETPYIEEDQFMGHVEKLEYLVFQIEAREKEFKESDLDTLAFIANLFNHTFGGPRLVVKQIKDEQNNSAKRFMFWINGHYLINKEGELSKIEFYEIIQEIQFMTFVQRMTKSLFQSLENDQIKTTKDYTIDDLIIKNFEFFKKEYKLNQKKKSQKVEEFQAFLEEQFCLEQF
ncbi:hypothetical protein TTHERM_01248960 (macronuclear) [Tetrahymena thermophila SB210]|uniref:Uncharacterized protein n=1 Tax=Tetrahymena thermophila (strain SB210) TaxID=312017 RepID=Q22AB2_TETTS|nr:hypothetical protein TTHERM_01248960 [Tetrahymena thermophila SB210]EAR82237.2 hypothetical protein TTHERM_01248960 [Tetrahymena thermophila SB210]|eukprot:XP_001029900.2 hypothetical protein TTHERM_01248960 [Tetrahymena thermophila SB210]